MFFSHLESYQGMQILFVWRFGWRLTLSTEKKLHFKSSVVTSFWKLKSTVKSKMWKLNFHPFVVFTKRKGSKYSCSLVWTEPLNCSRWPAHHVTAEPPILINNNPLKCHSFTFARPFSLRSMKSSPHFLLHTFPLPFPHSHPPLSVIQIILFIFHPFLFYSYVIYYSRPILKM